MADNKMKKYDRGSAFQRRFNERYKESVFNKLPKRSFFQFFEIFITKIGRFCLLNFLYLLFFAPFLVSFILILSAYMGNNFYNMILFLLLYLAVSIVYGPATSAFTYIIRKSIADESIILGHDFFDQYKKNFKQGAFMGVFDAVFLFGTYVYFEFILTMFLKLFRDGGSVSLSSGILLGLVCLAIVIGFTMRYYIYMMMVTVDLRMPQLIRNSLAFVVVGAPTNLLTALISAGLLTAGILLIPYTYFVLIPIGLSFFYLILYFNAYPKVKKHLIDPVDTQPSNEDEKIFSDEPVISEDEQDSSSDSNKP